MNTQPNIPSPIQSISRSKKDYSTLANLRRRFRHLMLIFDEFNFDHWYVYLLGFYVILTMLNVFIDIRVGFLFHNNGFYYFISYPRGTETLRSLTNWSYNLYIVGMFLTLAYFNRWRKSIPAFFQVLKSKRLAQAAGKNIQQEEEYEDFLKSYQNRLLSDKRYIFVGVVILVAFIAILKWWMFENFQYLVGLASFDLLIAIFHGAENVVRESLYTLLLCYFLATGVWIMSVTGLYIRKFTTKFEIAIQPNHPDNSGGLKPLGDFCLRMALSILLFGTFSVFYSIYRGASFWSSAAIILLIVFVFPLSYLAFFTPLWNIHSSMLKGKRAYEDEFASRAAKLEEKIRSSLDNDKLDEARFAKEEFEILQVLHPNKIGYPLWPFNLGIFLIFLTPQIIALLSLAIQLLPEVGVLKSFITH